MSKALVVGDLHLYYKEMKSTKKMVENNEVMLKGVYDALVADEDIKLLIFLGDIQHYTPRDLGEISKWMDWFKQFGELMLTRTPVNLKVLEREGEPNPKFKYPVFSLRGNHDSTVKNKQEIDFTFFDMLSKNGLLQNPKGLVFNDGPQLVYYDFRNFGDAYQELPETIDHRYKVISLFHDVLTHEYSPAWVKMALETVKTYDAPKCLLGVDFGIVGHVHDPEDIVEVVTTDQDSTPLWQIGSMGRTSVGGTNFRDVGYSVIVDTSDSVLDVNLLEIPVIPANDYFDFSTRLVNDNKKVAYKNFNLKMDELEISQRNIYDDIKAAEVDQLVKDAALSILQRVDDQAEEEKS